MPSILAPMAAVRLQPVARPEDVLPAWRGTPVEELLRCHDLGEPLRVHARPQLTVVTCVDHRIQLLMPEGFAYVLRAPGARSAAVSFGLAFTVGVGGVRAVAVVAHDDCLMVGLAGRRQAFVNGIAELAGWRRHEAEHFFDQHAPAWELDDAAAFAAAEAARLRAMFPRVLVAPLLYRHGDGMLVQVAGA